MPDDSVDGGVLVAATVLLLVGAAVGGSALVATNGTPPTGGTDGPAAGGTDGQPGSGSATGAGSETTATWNGSGSGAGGGPGQPELVAFADADAFRAYLARAPSDGRYVRARPTVEVTRDAAVEVDDAGGDGGVGGDDAAAAQVDATATPVATSTPTPMATPTPTQPETSGGAEPDAEGGPDRVAGTNVQVTGVDEPSLVKTTGGTTYYSLPRDRRVRPEPVGTDAGGPGGNGDDVPGGSSTVALDTSDPATPEIAGRVDASGRLLRTDDTLVVLTGASLVAYDVTDPEDPQRTWTRTLNDSVRAARLANGTVYLVLADRVDRRTPCPIRPMEGAAVPCDRVYHPSEPAPADTTYTTVAVDPADGTTLDSVSFVGSARTAATYVSRSGIYVTYVDGTGGGEAFLEYLRTEAGEDLPDRDRLPAFLRQRLAEIDSYDISSDSKREEAQRAVRRWVESHDDYRSDRLRRAIFEGFEDYRIEHKRELVRTGIVRVGYGGPDGLHVDTTGSVPGTPLNQFSMSERGEHLRIATTVDARGAGDSENDVYVLHQSNLSVAGSVQGMGLTERVYAVRFVGDKGYVVTFRRVDPFHVLDLSEPTDPELQGTLKLPGFSSYLHPLPGDRVLGIGEEDGRVKTVIFDVSDPTNPTVEESEVLSAGWSAVAQSHHAFLLDRKHGVFFLPTEEAGYVYDYETLERVDTVRVEGARRARYLDDYLYVFGDDELVVVDETTWERVERLRLDAD